MRPLCGSNRFPGVRSLQGEAGLHGGRQELKGGAWLLLMVWLGNSVSRFRGVVHGRLVLSLPMGCGAEFVVFQHWVVRLVSVIFGGDHRPKLSDALSGRLVLGTVEMVGGLFQ